uniref:Uncharacterized protein n=1 Tax=Oryza nivara TaxID=4536 RepID=A0A0E0GL48_ORYNI
MRIQPLPSGFGRPVAPKDCLRPQPPVAVLSSLKIEDSECKVSYNAMNIKYENSIKASVINPAKVRRCMLQNAA